MKVRIADGGPICMVEQGAGGVGMCKPVKCSDIEGVK